MAAHPVQDSTYWPDAWSLPLYTIMQSFFLIDEIYRAKRFGELLASSSHSQPIESEEEEP